MSAKITPSSWLSNPCAAGKWRGGIGMVRVNRFLVDTIVTCEGERQEADVPWGIYAATAKQRVATGGRRGIPERRREMRRRL